MKQSLKINEKHLCRSSAVQWGEGSRLQFPKHFEQHVGDIAELELNENPLGEEKFHQLKCLQPGHPWRSSEFHVGSTSSRSFLLWCCFIYIVNRWSWSSRERFPLWRVDVSIWKWSPDPKSVARDSADPRFQVWGIPQICCLRSFAVRVWFDLVSLTD